MGKAKKTDTCGSKEKQADSNGSKEKQVEANKAGSQQAAKSSSKHIEIGKRGECAAVRYLEKIGFDILDRNWTCPAGEVDIVARDMDAVVFCEVKTRTSFERGFPAEAVDAEKQSRYEKIAAWYLRDSEYVDVPVRFDVIALLVVSEDRAFIKHYVNAFAQGYC